MLYLRADATKGFNGGYHYDGRGVMRKVWLLSFSSFLPALKFDIPIHAKKARLDWT